MDNIKFPTKIILPNEAENFRHDLRRTVQKVQSNYLELRNDTDFVMPEWGRLSTQYCVDYYQTFLNTISNDITIDETQRLRLRNVWGRKKASAIFRTSIICNGIESTPQLNWQWDDKVKLPIPTASIDEVADQMATHDVPDQAVYHWTLLQSVVEAYKELRVFEQNKSIAKKPLQWLFRQNQTSFAEHWANGNFDMAEAPDEQTLQKWEIMNNAIF